MSRKYLVVGFGYMGKIYLKILLEFGISQLDIIVVDRDNGRLEECRKLYPDVFTATTLQDARFAPLSVGLCLVNSPEHLAVLTDFAEIGVRHVFVEKPLVLEHQLQEIRALDWEFSTFCVGYVINFSPALSRLVSLMKEQGLLLCGGSAEWSKNRIGDRRPTGGVVSDDLVHPLGVFDALLSVNQRVVHMNVMGSNALLPFADVAQQEKLHEKDPSYPLTPVATSHVAIKAGMFPPRNVHMFYHTSFVGFRQRREVQALFTSPGANEEVTHMACLEFDTPEGDVLSFLRVGDAAPVREVFQAKRKLQDQFEAFMTLVQSGKYDDPRLVLLKGGLRMTEVLVKIAESDLEKRAQFLAG